MKAKVANILPPAARDMLVAAAATRDPKMRVIAIEAAITWAKVHFPNYFHQPKE